MNNTTEKYAMFLKLLYEKCKEGNLYTLTPLISQYKITRELTRALIKDGVIKKITTPGVGIAYHWQVGEPNIKMAFHYQEKVNHSYYRKAKKSIKILQDNSEQIKNITNDSAFQPHFTSQKDNQITHLSEHIEEIEKEFEELRDYYFSKMTVIEISVKKSEEKINDLCVSNALIIGYLKLINLPTYAKIYKRGTRIFKIFKSLYLRVGFRNPFYQKHLTNG